ncbi:uncharacterized protein LOC116350127 [Contarinia nasturtii]|uniref:uncharacterized protein LOC116350127 n=1 Tax=Contarinia nasturtii TaxID=265458 RepID=UPI0012D37F65|nr:uncharacterized protein LOC116350127 [Contarinia nasturtii]
MIGTGELFGAEQVWVKINSNKKCIILVEVYIRPDSPYEVYVDNMNAIREIATSLKPDDVLLISGNFNLPNLVWFVDETIDPDIAIAINPTSRKEIVVLDTCYEMGLYQINKQYNQNGHMLDLIWTNEIDVFSCNASEDHFMNIESHHPSFEINIHEYIQHQPKSNNIFFDYKNAEYVEINDQLVEKNWDSILNRPSLEEKLDSFYYEISNVVSSNINRKVMNYSNIPKWFDKSLLNQKRDVNKLHRQMKKNSSAETKRIYIDIRRLYKQNARSTYKGYKLQIEQLINEDPKIFFNFVNQKKNRSDELPAEMEYNGNKAEDRQQIVEMFATHFSTAYSQHNEENKYDISDAVRLQNICAAIPEINITDDLVSEKISELPLDLVSGPDGIPNIFIKNCLPSLLYPITILLRESLQSNCIPQIWKTSFVRPVFKSGNRNKVENYRGVALQCIISKLLDSIVTSHINNYLKTIIDDSQHGFIKGRSTVTNLAKLTSKALNNIGNGYQTDSIYLDIAKAFDSWQKQSHVWLGLKFLEESLMTPGP